MSEFERLAIYLSIEKSFLLRFNIMSLILPADLSSLLNSTDWKSRLEALKKIKEAKLHLPEQVLSLGSSLLMSNSWQLGDSYWEVCEAVFYASLDCQASDWLKVRNIQFTYLTLKEKFGSTAKITRMDGIFFEYSGKFTDAEKVYDSLLETNPLDKLSWKRKVSLLRTTGHIDQAINEMNKYLEVFQDDLEAWEELCDIYLAMQHFVQAAFCYEEILLMNPDNFWVVLKYGEIVYSIGGPEKMVLARKYFIEALILNKKCVRAMWALWQCCSNIAGVKPDQVNTKIREKVVKLLQGVYKGNKFDVTKILA
jgi:tetratricopeptide (TPR) repeat protein